MQLQLRKFDISSMKDDKIVVLIGKRGTGKTEILKDILYFKRDFPIGTVINPTESANKSFSNIVPPIFIHEEYRPEIIDNVLKRQTMIMKKINKEIQLYGRSSIDPRAFLILDDCLYDNSWKRDKNIRYIFMNGRHKKLFFLVTMQFVLGISPELRTNVDYIFICRENIISNRKRLYDAFAGMFPTFECFCSVLDQCTENFECLVIDNTSRSNKLEDQVYWYKAELRADFTIGSHQLWELHNQTAADDDEADEELFDITSFRKKKNTPQLSVKKTY
jgi:Poxvirus A32 protein